MTQNYAKRVTLEQQVHSGLMSFAMEDQQG